MKLEKDGVVKEIEENLVADYITAGWNKYIEPKAENKPKKEEKIKDGEKI